MNEKTDQTDASNADGTNGSIVEDQSRISSFNPERLLAMSGYVMLVISATLLFLLAFRYFTHGGAELPTKETDIVFWYLSAYGFEIIILFGSIVLMMIGTKLLGAAGKGNASVIPPQERDLLEPLIREGKKESIEQYVILSSLSGFTGTFQKIGFSGLPLATATLTIVFSLLSFKNPAFLEMAKLTLGAFIGSFVQQGKGGISIKGKGE